MNAKDKLKSLFQKADIDIIDGHGYKQPRPWDIRVFNDRLYDRVLSYGSLGLGEAYMDKWWDCLEPDNFIYRILKKDLHKFINLSDILLLIKAKLTNLQSLSRAFEVGIKHYDIGNELYEHMLDNRMVYSCGYWDNAKNLEEAQEAKLELICQKINLKSGMEVLDVGCGWGSFAKYAAEKYNARVTGITISKEQFKYAEKTCSDLDAIFYLEDYRDFARRNLQFDAIVSIGMFEHVGVKNYRTYMEAVNQCLKPEGKFLLHTIGNSTSAKFGDSFLNKYIFPNGMLPSVQQIGQSAESVFNVEHWENIGPHYEKTLLAWHENFEENWTKISSSSSEYNEKFYRLWKYYLLSCAGAFKAKHIHVWQIVMSKHKSISN